MNETVKNKIKQEDKSAKKKFAVIMLLAVIVGIVIGFSSSILGLFYANSGKSIYRVLGEIGLAISRRMPYLLLIFTLIMGIVMISLYRSARKQFSDCDGEDEAALKKIENKNSTGLILTNVHYIVSFTMFAISFSNMRTMDKRSDYIGILISTFVFCAGLILYLQMQKKYVNLTKEMNPEKQGSVYDLKFRSKWLESCDEAEQVLIYKSAYKAYTVITYVFLALMLVFTITSLTFGIGIFQLILVASLWLVLNLVYGLESMKLSK